MLSDAPVGYRVACPSGKEARQMGIGGTKSISAPMYSVLIQAAGKASKKRFQQTSQKWLIEFERSQAPDDSRMIT